MLPFFYVLYVRISRQLTFIRYHRRSYQVRAGSMFYYRSLQFLHLGVRGCWPLLNLPDKPL